MPLPDTERLLGSALMRVPSASRLKALEIGESASAALGCCFQSLQISSPSALADLPSGEFNFVAAVQAVDQAPILILREASRLLAEDGIFCACLNNVFSRGDLIDLSRDLDFQMYLFESGERLTLIWRKRAPLWRGGLADQAPLASTRISRVVNTTDHSRVVPARGRYAVISICADALPLDVDLVDLEVLVGGIRATAVSLSPPDARGQQEIIAQLPGLEQTGLVPVALHWLGERLTAEPAYIRVIPPGPIVPRIVSVATPGRGIVISIEELARPDELTALLDGEPLWGLEASCVDARIQHHMVRLPLPEEVQAGVHEIQLTAGRCKLPPISIEIH